jgi:uncharacterized protein
LRTVDEYIDQLPDERRKIAEQVRLLLLENVPGIQEKLSFKIPFYHYFGMFMYINNTKEGIDIGFCRGKDLAMAFPQLELKNRAMVATVLLQTPKDINSKALKSLIIAAAVWNEEAKRMKLPMVKKKKK